VINHWLKTRVVAIMATSASFSNLKLFNGLKAPLINENALSDGARKRVSSTARFTRNKQQRAGRLARESRSMMTAMEHQNRDQQSEQPSSPDEVCILMIRDRFLQNFTFNSNGASISVSTGHQRMASFLPGKKHICVPAQVELMFIASRHAPRMP
jgi:hypothetical protein